MMRFPSKKIVEQVRKEYSIGSRVELVRMDDVQAPPLEPKERSRVWMIQQALWLLGTMVQD